MKRNIVMVVAAILALPLVYLLAGAIGGAVPVNAGWRAPDAGIEILVEDNGVHTSLILPVSAAGVDWRSVAPARDLGDPRYGAYDHVALSWGERGFFLETPTWADLRASTLVAAATGSDHTLIHVEYLPAPDLSDSVRRIVLRPDEYRRLSAFVIRSFASRPEHYRGYADYDVFYDARGHYSALRTCNTWTGEALRAAGVPTGWWTPFPATVMLWLPPP